MSDEVKWIKQIKIREGVGDIKKLKLLGALLKKLANHGKRSKMVRDQANWILKNTGGHWDEREHTHPLRFVKGKYYCTACHAVHPIKNKKHIEHAGFSKPVAHKHRVWKKGVKPHDHAGEVRAVQEWVQGCRYTFDPHAVEYFVTPRRALIEVQKGIEGLDCDDLSTLTCALLGSIGYETAVLITNPKGQGAPFSHAMTAVKLPKTAFGYYGAKKITWPAHTWIPLELTIPEKMGWLPPKADKFMYFKI